MCVCLAHHILKRAEFIATNGVSATFSAFFCPFQLRHLLNSLANLQNSLEKCRERCIWGKSRSVCTPMSCSMQHSMSRKALFADPKNVARSGFPKRVVRITSKHNTIDFKCIEDPTSVNRQVLERTDNTQQKPSPISMVKSFPQHA